jgi:hypothetical protein
MTDDDPRPARVGTEMLLEMTTIQGEQLAQLTDIVHRVSEQVAAHARAIATLRALVETLRDSRAKH